MTALSDIDALITQFVTEQTGPLQSALNVANQSNSGLIEQVQDLQAKWDASNTLAANLQTSLQTMTADRDAVAALLAQYKNKYGPLQEIIKLAANFTQHSSGLYSPLGFTGKGRDITQYRMDDMSSQRGPEIAKLVAPTPNSFYLMWMAGTDVGKWAVNDAIAQDFSLIGPYLGHTFGGLEVGPGARAIIRRLLIKNVLGKLNGPPEETGLLSLWGQVGALIEDVILDGTDMNGKPNASSPLMLSSCTDTTINDLVATGGIFGFGAANWRGSGKTVYNRGSFTKNRRHVNIEQAEPGSSFVFNQTQFDIPSDGFITQISTRNMGRATLLYQDVETTTGKIPVKVYTAQANPKDGYNGMQDSDIKVMDKGVDTTKARLQFIR